MAEKKSSSKLRIPMPFDEAVSDFLKVRPTGKKPRPKVKVEKSNERLCSYSDFARGS
jgi:hypothetical protein